MYNNTTLQSGWVPLAFRPLLLLLSGMLESDQCTNVEAHAAHRRIAKTIVIRTQGHRAHTTYVRE